MYQRVTRKTRNDIDLVDVDTLWVLLECFYFSS